MLVAEADRPPCGPECCLHAGRSPFLTGASDDEGEVRAYSMLFSAYSVRCRRGTGLITAIQCLFSAYPVPIQCCGRRSWAFGDLSNPWTFMAAVFEAEGNSSDHTCMLIAIATGRGGGEEGRRGGSACPQANREVW